MADGEGETSVTLAPPQKEEEPISPHWSALIIIASGYWLSRGHRVCPITQKPLTNFRLIPNYALPRLISDHRNGEEVYHKMKDPVIIERGYTMGRDFIEDFLRKRGRLEHTMLIPNNAFHRIMSEHCKQRGLKSLPNLNQDDFSFGDLVNRMAMGQFELLIRHIPLLQPVGSQKAQVITPLKWLVFNHPNDCEIQELAAVILNFCNRRDVKKKTAADKILEAGPTEDELEAARYGVLQKLRSLSVILLVGSEKIFNMGFGASSVRQKRKY